MRLPRSAKPGCAAMASRTCTAGDRHRITDGFDDFHLLLYGNAKSGTNESRQRLARRPGFLSHEADSRRAVPVARIHRGRQHVVDG